MLPQVKFDDDVSIGKNTHFICVQPFLGASYEEMVRRGAKPISANFPFGVKAPQSGYGQSQRGLVFQKLSSIRWWPRKIESGTSCSSGR